VSGQRKILIADDVNFFLKLEKSFLQRDEIDILTARNGQEAYDLIVLCRPDLVLLDMYMPEMNGDECCRRIKNNAELSHIPVIMVTAGEDDQRAQCRDAGCDDIILKPFDREAFVGTVQKFLKVAQRADVRVPLKMEVKYGSGQLLTGYSVDLSAGGLFLATEHLLSIDASLSLKFYLPDQVQPICCLGSVAWLNSPESPCDQALPIGMGIRFLNLAIEDMSQIRELLQANRSGSQ
jgi:uncharacterized protein (TIGR02266 family)